ncbi:MAG TPA: ABC transporter ATP-binding protein [Burkholderiales bacterium]
MRGSARSTLAKLEVRGLSAGYGRARVLFDIDLEVGEGEVVALLGRNGAGKSTTLKAIMGLVPPSSGTVVFDGRPLGGLEPHQIARLGLGYVPEDRRIFTDLTVTENLEVGRQGPRSGAPAWTDEKLFALFPALAPLRERRGGRMSGGEQQMLCIARTLAGNPSAILLDEPSEGLAPLVVEQVARAVLEMKRAGLAVLLAEQSRQFTGRVADRGYLLEKGVIARA